MKAAPIGTHRVFFSSSPLLLSSLELSDTTIHEPSIPCVCGRLRGAFCRGNQHTSQAGHALRSTCRRLESCTTARLSSPAHTSHTSAPNGGFNQHQTAASISTKRRFQSAPNGGFNQHLTAFSIRTKPQSQSAPNDGFDQIRTAVSPSEPNGEQTPLHGGPIVSTCSYLTQCISQVVL